MSEGQCFMATTPYFCWRQYLQEIWANPPLKLFTGAIWMKEAACLVHVWLIMCSCMRLLEIAGSLISNSNVACLILCVLLFVMSTSIDRAWFLRAIWVDMSCHKWLLLCDLLVRGVSLFKLKYPITKRSN
jgi:hypothetical protein